MANELKYPVKLTVACARWDLDLSWYYKLAKDNKVPKPIRGEIEILDADVALINYYRNLSEGKEDESLTDVRIRLTRINADRKELELKKAKGELINVEIAMRLWGQVLMSMRQKLLAIPIKLAPLVLGIKRLAECKETAEKFIFEVLNELANPEFKRIAGMGGNNAGHADVKATTKTKRKRMGRRKKSVKSRVKRRAR